MAKLDALGEPINWDDYEEQEIKIPAPPKPKKWQYDYVAKIHDYAAAAVKIEPEENNILYDIRDPRGETILSINSDLEVTINPKLKTQEAAVEFWDYVLKYIPDPKKYTNISDMRYAAVYAVGAVNTLLREVDKAKLSKECLEAVERGSNKAETVFK